jgi:hypothetical protein
MAPVMPRVRTLTALALALGLPRAAAWASPWDDPLVHAFGRSVRGCPAPVFLGDGEWGPMAWTRKYRSSGVWGDGCPGGASLGDSLFAAALGPEIEALEDPREPVFALEPGASLALGDITPANASGDLEEGLVSPRGFAVLRVYGRGFEALLEPEIGMELGGGPVAAGLVPRQAWVGWRNPQLLVGFGMRDRWLGPGRRGSLLLSDNARAAPMGTLAAQGRLPGVFDALGSFRFESSWGWLQRPRDDVDNPGLMLMDLRWLPVPWIELGATRLGLFGGAGRPMPGLLELLVPTDPHVYDDPDKEEADQNEQASLDVRVTLPLAHWVGGPVDYVEGWWQYGAEDIIARKLGSVPYPSLAGVANLWGLEGALGPWVLSYEGSHIFDDYFRWYVSHRIYHDGFTQDGRVLGHHGGGDASTTWLRLGWYPLPWGADLAFERVHRVGVVESLESHIFALAADEWREGVTLRLLRVGTAGQRWSVGYGFSRVQGLDFVPGGDTWQHRLSVSWSAGPLAGEPAASGG